MTVIIPAKDCTGVLPVLTVLHAKVLELELLLVRRAAEVKIALGLAALECPRQEDADAVGQELSAMGLGLPQLLERALLDDRVRQCHL